jgi:hypothetical protein
MYLIFKRLFLVVAFLLALNLGLVNAAYIKVIGLNMGGTSYGGAGYSLPLPLLNFSFFSHNRFAYSINADLIGIYGLGLNPLGNIDKIIDKNDKSTSGEKLRKIVDTAKNISTFSASTLNVEYDLFNKRGFYVFAGLGYGLQVSVRKEGVNLIKTINDLQNNNIFNKDLSSEESLTALVKDKEFQQNLQSSAFTLLSVFQTLLPQASGLTNQIKEIVNNPSLIDNEEYLEDWLNRAEQEFDKLEDVDFEKAFNSNLQKLLKDNILHINQGIAYTLGVGYDLKILGPLGLDLNAKVSGLLAKPFIPVYNIGASLIFKW